MMNIILTGLNAIFSILWFCFFAPSDSRFSNNCISAKYCPILTNHTSNESLFNQLFVYTYWHLWLVLWSLKTVLTHYKLNSNILETSQNTTATTYSRDTLATTPKMLQSDLNMTRKKTLYILASSLHATRIHQQHHIYQLNSYQRSNYIEID